MSGTLPCPGCGNPIPAVPGNTICVKCGGTVHVYQTPDLKAKGG